MAIPEGTKFSPFHNRYCRVLRGRGWMAMPEVRQSMSSAGQLDRELGKAGAATALTQQRRKGVGNRAWLVVTETGQSHMEEVGKHSIMKRTGLPARDLRALDPKLSYPSSILGRERAIVINLEHIKAIITAKEVLITYSLSPLIVQFVQDLQQRVSCSSADHPEGTNNQNGLMEDVAGDKHRSLSIHRHNEVSCSSDNLSMEEEEVELDNNARTAVTDVATDSGPKPLSFEFKALEACLESACRCLESETQTLEQEAYPALDELTSKISTLNLERVRQIKSRLVAISGRVQKVRDEIEHLLDDDNDMAEMYLTEKHLYQSQVSRSMREDSYNAVADVDVGRNDECKSAHGSENNTSFKPNVEELEMLLEAYFAQIDGILQKLSHMSDYVDDTEDCINIMLDDKQNQLLQMGVMLSTANMMINAAIVVVGLFGMNINISLFEGQPSHFWETTLGTVGGCVALYMIAVGWGKKKKLIAL